MKIYIPEVTAYDPHGGIESTVFDSLDDCCQYLLDGIARGSWDHYYDARHAVIAIDTDKLSIKRYQFNPVPTPKPYTLEEEVMYERR